MRRFKLRSGSGIGENTREEADNHMLCKQDPRRSSNKLHDYVETTFGGGLLTVRFSAVVENTWSLVKKKYNFELTMIWRYEIK